MQKYRDAQAAAEDMSDARQVSLLGKHRYKKKPRKTQRFQGILVVATGLEPVTPSM